MFITFSMAVMRMSGAIGFNPLFGKSNFPVKIRKKWIFVPNFEMKVISPKICFEINYKNSKNAYSYAFFSTFLFEFEGEKMRKMGEISTKSNENLKILFD